MTFEEMVQELEVVGVRNPVTLTTPDQQLEFCHAILRKPAAALTAAERFALQMTQAQGGQIVFTHAVRALGALPTELRMVQEEEDLIWL